MDLKTFLLARIAEDEKLAEAAVISRYGERHKERWDYTSYVMSMDRDSTAAQDEFITEFWPPRVLAECAAKRAIVERWEDWPADAGWRGDAADAGHLQAVDHAARAIAAVYADHPDYQPEWKLAE